jgi:hypothetical protein
MNGLAHSSSYCVYGTASRFSRLTLDLIYENAHRSSGDVAPAEFDIPLGRRSFRERGQLAGPELDDMVRRSLPQL